MEQSGIAELFSTQRTTQAMRDALAGARDLLDVPPPPVEHCDDITLPGAQGDLGARIYRPYRAVEGAGLVFFHGGGFMVGGLDSPVDDARAVLDAALEGALSDYGFDAGRLSVGGDSAGGNLAAGLAQYARGRLAFQLLIYPLLQLAEVKKARPRWQEGPILSVRLLEDIVKVYLAGADAADLRASPLFENDLSGVAPTYILAAEFDPLMDEDRAYSERLAASGVPVTFKLWNASPHGFLNMSRLAPACIPAIEHAAKALAKAYA